MSSDVDSALKKVAKGSGAVFVGTASGMVLALVWRLLVIHSLTPTEFGTFFLAFSIINLLTAMATLGLPDGLPRYIAYFHGKGEEKKIGAAIKASMHITVVFSGIIVLSVFIVSPWMAGYMAMKGLDTSLQVMLLGIPFFAMAVMLTAVFRGYGVARVKVYFIEFSRRLFIFIGVSVLILLGITNLLSVSAVVCLSSIGVFSAVGWYYHRKKPEYETVTNRNEIREIEKKVMIF